MGSRLKKYLSVFLIVLVIGVLAACSSKESASESGDSSDKKEEKVVEFWTIALQPTFNDYFKDVIGNFEKENPGVKIDWKDYPYDAIQNKLLTSIASGNAPGVVNLNTMMANQMGTKDALVDFNKELSDDEKAAYFEGIYSSTEIDGKANAVPWYTGLPVLFFNKELVEKAGLDPNNPPTTKAELNEWGKTIKEKTGAFGYVFTMESRSILEEGYKLLSDDFSKAAFNNSDVKDYIQGNIDLMAKGVIPNDVLNYEKQVQLFGSEQVAMILSSASFINQIKTASPDVYEKMIAVPSPVGEAGIRFSNTMNLVVPAKTKNKDEAVDFAVYVSNAKNQLAFSKVASTLPSTVESAKDEFFSKNDGTIEGQALAASAGSLDKATDFYIGIAAANDVNATITKHLQNIYLNNADIDDELSAAEKAVNDIIAKNK